MEFCSYHLRRLPQKIFLHLETLGIIQLHIDLLLSPSARHILQRRKPQVKRSQRKKLLLPNPLKTRPQSQRQSSPQGVNSHHR